MLDSQQKRKIRNIMYSKVTLVVLFFLVIFSVHSAFNVYQKKEESQHLRDISAQNEANLQKRYNAITTDVNSLQTEAGLEADIRSKFDVAKNGENTVVIVDSEVTTTPATTTLKSFWQKIESIFHF